MALRPILQIPIDDSKLKAAADHVKRMQELAAKMPASWKALEESAKGTGKATQAIIAAMTAQTAILAESIESQHKLALEADKTASSWRRIANSAGDTAKSTTGITKSLTGMVWRLFSGLGGAIGAVATGGVIGGIAGLLGLGAAAYGMARAGEAVGDYRRYAMGLGSTIGQTRAFGLDLGRFINPQQFLGAAAEGIYDFRSPAYRAMMIAGVNPQAMQGGNAVQLSEALLTSPRLINLFRQAPKGAWGALLEQTGLGAFMGGQDVERWLSHPAEFAKQMEAARRDEKSLQIADQTAKTWVDMNTSIERAEGAIFSTFVKGTEPVAKSFGDLAGSATTAATALSRLTDQIMGGPKVVTTGPLAGQMINPTNLSDEEKRAIAAGQVPSSWQTYTNKTSPVPIYTEGGLGMFDFGAGADMMALIRRLEGSGDMAVSPAGAIGRYQIMPGTARQYGFDSGRLTDPSYNTAVASAIIQDLSRRYNTVDEVLAAYNAGPGAANRFRRAGDDLSTLPAETRAYIMRAHQMGSARIEITKSTGADVNVSVSQLSPGGSAAPP